MDYRELHLPATCYTPAEMIRLLCVCCLLLGCNPALAAERSLPCTVADTPETTPHPVDLKKLYATISQLKTTDGTVQAISLTDDVKTKLADIFRRAPPRTKLDQFYRMLYLLAESYPWTEHRDVTLEGLSTAAILQAAAVINQPDFLKRLDSFQLTFPQGRDPVYQVEYTGDETEFPLNGGKGFSLYRNGMCQTTRSLLFRRHFSFKMNVSPKSHNLLVYDFKGVDLVGDFGTRVPLIKIDLNYVTLSSVEFIEGTNLGIVKAKVSRHEFEVNDHNWLLKTVTRYVGDTSTQPIDW